MKRLSLYSSVLPRVRSNSLSTLAVVQAPTPSRPAPKQSQHSQLALTHVQPSQALHPALISYAPQISPNPIQPPSSSSLSTPHPDHTRSRKRQRLDYQLDVGAYGIPKSRSFHSSASTNAHPHTSLSVQVGEDAYFIRDNAMGIADGVGGWAKSASSSPSPTPSALFSRRLMHFCSAELDSLALHQQQSQLQSESTRPPSLPSFSFTHHLQPPPSTPSPYPPIHDACLTDDLATSLQELSEGINVLNILEHAYNSTLKAHTNPSLPIPVPLTTGSSTALLAVLDHPPPPTHHQKVSLHKSPASHPNYAAGSLPHDPHPTFTPDPASPSSHPYDAVLRIAHLGDCMGMLVRADDIVWRSDEMWWGYNHPLQLGPLDPSLPRAPATAQHPLPVQPHTFTLPVKKDDILILASDGLSDNLWDDDILDEVVKFRRGFSWDHTPASYPSTPVRSRSASPTSRSSSASSSSSGSSRHSSSSCSSSTTTTPPSLSESLSNLTLTPSTTLPRKAFAGMLSEALCSRAKRVSERRRSGRSGRSSARKGHRCAAIDEVEEGEVGKGVGEVGEGRREAGKGMDGHVPVGEEADEIPFARRARMSGRVFKGGKPDDISVVVALISAVDATGRVEVNAIG